MTAGQKTTRENENGCPNDAPGISPRNGRTINHNGGGRDDDGGEKGNDAESAGHKSLSSRFHSTKVNRSDDGLQRLVSNTERLAIRAQYESQRDRRTSAVTKWNATTRPKS